MQIEDVENLMQLSMLVCSHLKVDGLKMNPGVQLWQEVAEDSKQFSIFKKGRQTFEGMFE